MKKPIIVIKFGSASITDSKGEIDEETLSETARQIALIQKDYHIVIVSSGAVAAGKKYLKKYSGTITEKKAAASIGNPLLLNKYSRYFSEYGISIAQSLCEREHFSSRKRFLQLKETYTELWKNDIIPIANENDVVSNFELKFSDNDELATLIAVGFGAQMLIFSTSVAGLLDADGKVVQLIPEINEDTLMLAGKEKSASGLGGMVSKLTFARLATRMGIKTVIFGVKTPDGILKVLKAETGSVFLPAESSLPARKKWLASGSVAIGKIRIDEGAKQAILKKKSLLAVGITHIVEGFESGEVIELLDDEENTVAVARAQVSSAILSSNFKTKNFEIAHADDIVVL